MENLQLIAHQANATLVKNKITTLGCRAENNAVSIYFIKCRNGMSNPLSNIPNCKPETKKTYDKLSLEQAIAIADICKKNKEVQFIVKPLFKK